MKRLSRPLDIDIPDHLLSVIVEEFDDASSFGHLFDEFFQHKSYHRPFVLKLIQAAKGHSSHSWEIRRLSILMLEHQVLKLSPENLTEFDFLFSQLSLKSSDGEGGKVDDFVLREGYSTTKTASFIIEFRRKLQRLDRVHRGIKGRKTSSIALRDFINVSRRDCKLCLARYLFTPEEVVERIFNQIQLSRGVLDENSSESFPMKQEIRQAFADLPDFEAQILKGLGRDCKICWVSESTTSEINSLVEYPLATVVLVIKPPGSDIEFEIKRTGRKRPNLLNVVYKRNGEIVVLPHRLDGGSMFRSLQWEARAAAVLSSIFRLVHGTDAPISKPLSISNIYAIPSRAGKVHILDYFTKPEVFGAGFREMRVAMRRSVEALKNGDGGDVPDLPGDLGLTVSFLTKFAPAQAILSGTSSFRLDRIADYLSSDGPERYFGEGFGIQYSETDAKWFADEVLEEVLGVYTPPAGRYQNYEQYVQQAISFPANRARADHNYLSVMQQIGSFWGTLMGIKGFSFGESFVGRNVGLKSFYDGGQWKVKIIFMDHDDVQIAGARSEGFRPLSALKGMTLDERFIWRDPMREGSVKSEASLLEQIYRIEPGMKKKARMMAHDAMRHSYKKTQKELDTNPELQQFFSRLFLEQIRDWDFIAGNYLESKDGPSGFDNWRAEAQGFLRSKNYDEALIDEFINSIKEYASFIEKYAFLYSPKYLPLSCS